MTKALLTTAANGHNFLTIEDHETPQWRLAIEWLKDAGFSESGTSIVTLDEGIFPSFIINSALLIKSEREQYSVFDMHPLN